MLAITRMVLMALGSGISMVASLMLLLVIVSISSHLGRLLSGRLFQEPVLVELMTAV